MPEDISLAEHFNPLAELFGARIREARIRAGLKQGQLAERACLNPNYVSLLERGKANPTLDVMARLAHAVGTEVSDLIRTAD